MSRSWRAGCMLAGLTVLAAQAAEPSLCTRLADEARKAPASNWAQPDPLAAWVKPAPPAAPSPIVTALAGDARWRELLALPDGRSGAVQQLPGAPVYLLDEVAGTAHCQSMVLVQAQPGQRVVQLKPPFPLRDMELCVTQSAGFAQVLGTPAFIVGGAPSMTSPDFHYRIATWGSSGWAQRCSITLQRQTAMTVAQRFCRPGSPVCKGAQSFAQRLALAYEAARRTGKPLDAQAFNAGQQPDAATAAALNPPLAEPDAVGDLNPPFPLFGASEQGLDPMLTVFSNADPQRLPVLVDGQWWLAVVGRSGVGWREGGAVLVALFMPPGRAADGVASYQFRIQPSGLRDVVARDEKPAAAGRPETQKAR